MPTLEDVKKQISSLDGTSMLLGRKEIKELPKILWEDEQIEQIIQGVYNNSMGILVATNKRLVFVDKGIIFGLKVEDFPYDKITSIQYQTGIIFGEITIFASGNRAEIKNMEKGRTRTFAEFVRARITQPSSNASIKDNNSNSSNEETIKQLERLATLKEKGILTEDEFNEQKKKILNG